MSTPTHLLAEAQREDVRAILCRVASDRAMALPDKPAVAAAISILDEELGKAVAAAATRLGADAAQFDEITRYRAAMEILKRKVEAIR